jgi:lipopolysaccharide transport system ATP-binding protein
MSDVASVGRTLLFVSHNMATIQRFCGRVVLLDSGGFAGEGEPSKIVSRYFRLNNPGALGSSIKWDRTTAPGNGRLLLRQIEVLGPDGYPVPDQVLSSDELAVMLEFEALGMLDRLVVGIEIWQLDGTAVLTTYHQDTDDYRQLRHEAGLNRWKVSIPVGLLNAGRYVVTACIGEHDRGWICRAEAAVRFSVIFNHGTSQLLREYQTRGIIRPGVIAPLLEWEKLPTAQL